MSLLVLVKQTDNLIPQRIVFLLLRFLSGCSFCIAFQRSSHCKAAPVARNTPKRDFTQFGREHSNISNLSCRGLSFLEFSCFSEGIEEPLPVVWVHWGSTTVSILYCLSLFIPCSQPFVGLEDFLSQSDGFGGHFNEFVFFDEFEGLL